jgi:hypothetical protein
MNIYRARTPPAWGVDRSRRYHVQRQHVPFAYRDRVSKPLVSLCGPLVAMGKCALEVRLDGPPRDSAGLEIEGKSRESQGPHVETHSSSGSPRRHPHGNLHTPPLAYSTCVVAELEWRGWGWDVRSTRRGCSRVPAFGTVEYHRRGEELSVSAHTCPGSVQSSTIFGK